jgi:hypothetical protein
VYFPNDASVFLTNVMLSGLGGYPDLPAHATVADRPGEEKQPCSSLLLGAQS